MAPFSIRLQLAQAFVRDLGSDRVHVSAIERDIWTGGPVSSLALLRAVAAYNPGQIPVLIIGPDNAKRLHEFTDFDTLAREFSVHVVKEPSNSMLRSTEVRRRMLMQEPYQDAVTPSVAQLLKTRAPHFIELSSGL
jgi:nicotinic acid mononucleotide adenylyltransferase